MQKGAGSRKVGGEDGRLRRYQGSEVIAFGAADGILGKFEGVRGVYRPGFMDLTGLLLVKAMIVEGGLTSTVHLEERGEC